MRFLRWTLATPYPYAALCVPAAVLVMGYDWGRVGLALAGGVALFGLAGWVAYRRETVIDQMSSMRASRARAKAKWPAVQRLGRGGYAAGVSMASSRVRGHVLVFVPEGVGAWHYAHEPSRWGRGRPDVVEFATYEALSAALEAAGFGYLPPSAYSRSLVEGLAHRLAMSGVTRESLDAAAAGARPVTELTVTAPIAVGGPWLAEFERRAPTRVEADQVIAEGLGLALRRMPRAQRDLEFLQWLPDLRALWICGRVNVQAVGGLTALTQLSLISTGDEPVDLSGLAELVLYEGELKGRESVLALPLTELFLYDVGEGQLRSVPATLEHLSLGDATGLANLDDVVAATGLRELRVDGADVLDVSAAATLQKLRRLSLSGTRRVTGIAALAHASGLRELHLSDIDSVDDPSALRALRGVSITVSGSDPRDIADGSTRMEM